MPDASIPVQRCSTGPSPRVYATTIPGTFRSRRTSSTIARMELVGRSFDSEHGWISSKAPPRNEAPDRPGRRLSGSSHSQRAAGTGLPPSTAGGRATAAPIPPLAPLDHDRIVDGSHGIPFGLGTCSRFGAAGNGTRGR